MAKYLWCVQIYSYIVTVIQGMDWQLLIGEDGALQLSVSDIFTVWAWAAHSFSIGDNLSNFSSLNFIVLFDVTFRKHCEPGETEKN